jgi:diaminohydroxyphosphoribosylaminopyrimidine deaminase/5-amino-6-(5-phosphoribosylamino)uracil reductase
VSPSPSEEQLIERALELAERGRGKTRPNPVVGALVVKDGKVVGEGWHERAGGPHAEIFALEQAGAGARGATIVVTLEPCCFSGLTGPCCERIIEAGIARVVAAVVDPNPRVSGRGLARLREAGVAVEVAEGEIAFRARRQNEAWRTWIAAERPFVTYKVATTLDGRVTLPGSRWLSGEESRRRVHELRAASDAVAVGMGTVLADSPQLDARDVAGGAEHQPRRLAFGKGPLPQESELELRSGPIAEELAALAKDGVQSLLLEGGPTLATAFVEAGLVDKLLVFVAPYLAGAGPKLFGELTHPLRLSRVSSERIGEDVLISAYIHEP